jgi:hypothetical protein
MTFGPCDNSESELKSCSKKFRISLANTKLRKVNEIDEVSIDFNNMTLEGRDMKAMMLVEDPIVEGGSESFVSNQMLVPLKSF